MKQVILIMVDTQRQDMLSCYSESAPRTPNLDALANDGVTFSNSFTCQPVCGPARSAIFTGLFPHSNGMVANCMQLGENVKNAGQWLTPQGIECAYIGKWHLDGGDYFGYGKCANGYNPQYWYDMRNFLDELPSDAARKLSRVNMNLRVDDPREEDTFAHRCADRAIKFVEEFKEKDFFLTMSLDEPHDPSVCPKRFFQQLKREKFAFKRSPNCKAKLDGKPPHHTIFAKKFKHIPFFVLKKSANALFACDKFCDYEIGRVLDKVKELGENPLIIYTSDHGDMLLSHSLMGKGCVMYNEITKIPLIISGGNFEKAVNSTPVSHIDLLPTIMDFFGVKIPKMLQGEPIQKLAKDSERNVFVEFTRYEVDHDGFMGFQPSRCVCNGKFKLVINLLSSDEFYDLQSDPYEKINRILDENCSQTRDKMHDDLIEHMNSTRDVYRGYYWLCRPWRKNVTATYDFCGYTRQLQEEDFVQLDYNTGLAMKDSVRKK
ncbi:MAG: sulfatase-like hydrolase/transferase [Clostridia bacterium]